jgi:hypothetical protein
MFLAAAIWVLAATVADLPRADQLAYAKRFAEAEVLYRGIVAAAPRSRDARLGLARVVMWQGRYDESIALFDAIEPQDAETIEGRATAAYWSGDFRTAARDFRRALELDPNRELARASLAEIASTMVPTQRITAAAATDDQPLDGAHVETAATFFSDPLTRWSAVAGWYHLDGERLGAASGDFARLENRTTLGRMVVGASAGIFHFPDGAYRPVGSASVTLRPFTLSVDRRPELAAATALRTHATSTTTAFRWDHEGAWIGAAEISHRSYFDENEGFALIAYGVAPLWTRADWTLWAGASAAVRDTDESRFSVTAVSAGREGSAWRYRYRGEYDPYWTPNDLVEARAVVSAERKWSRGSLKVHADGGIARDRGRAFGPETGPQPFPAAVFPMDFDRTWHPFRIGLTSGFELTPSLTIEVGGELGATIDYRSTSIHASLVRRR